MKKLILICLTLFLLSGCSFKTGDELLKAPKPSKDYIALQNKLDKEIANGSVFAQPETGTNRNTVQLVDIDADSEEEAIAFFRESAVSGKFEVIAYKKIGNEYIEMGRITGVGSSIDKVEYPKLSPVGAGGIAISWKIANELERGLTVAKFEEGTFKTVLDTTYMSYTIFDIDADGLDEIFTITKEQDKPIINMYKMIDGDMELAASSYLSESIESVAKLTTGELISGTRAIAIDSRVKEDVGLVTDLITINQEGVLENLTINKDTGLSMSTYRLINTFTTKLYNNNVLYIPTITTMKGFKEESLNSIAFVTNWHLYDLYNPSQSDLYTYHSTAEGWYYKLTKDQKDHIGVKKSTASNIKITTFVHQIDENKHTPLFEIYTIPRDEYEENHFGNGYLMLGNDATNMFIAKNLKPADSKNVKDSEIIDNFQIISSHD